MTYNVLPQLVRSASFFNSVIDLQGIGASFGGPKGNDSSWVQDVKARVDVAITSVVYLVIMVSMYWVTTVTTDVILKGGEVYSFV